MNDTQVDNGTCHTSGCPMIGSMSRESGSDKWYCFLHIGAAPGTSHAITAELNRMGWLVAIVRGLRAGGHNGFAEETRQAIAMAQQNHLQQGDNESNVAWMVRLETVLATSCKNSLTPQP